MIRPLRSTALVSRAQALSEDGFEGEWDEEDFRQGTARCLDVGEFRLVLAVEAIPEELREIVRFLNEHSSSGLEVLALELSYRKDGDLEILDPHTWGEESAGSRPGDVRPVLDREALLAKLRDHNEASADAARAILDWADGEARVTTRYTKTAAAIEADARWLISLLASDDRWLGHLELNDETLTTDGGPWDDEDRVTRLLRDLADVGVDYKTDRRYLTAPLESLADPARQQQFFKLMEETLDTLTVSP